MTETRGMDKNSLSKCCLQDTHFIYKDIKKLKVKGKVKIIHGNSQPKKSSGGYIFARQNRL